MATQEEIAIDTDIDELLKEALENSQPYKLILFNDDHHDMVEVMLQLIRAVKCTKKKALELMMKAHNTGQAVVMVDTQKKVQKAGSILQEIELAIEILKA